jgi:uncharacterized membrane protein
MSRAELWARLAADGLVEGDEPAADRNASPWFVRVMLGIAGWIGAAFLLMFVGAAFAFVMKDAASALVVGLACCAAAWGLFRRFGDADFTAQFALAVSLAGQGLIVVALAQYLKPEHPPFYLAVAATQAVLALAMPNFLHRMLASAGAAVALALAINQARLHGLAAPLLCFGLVWIWLEPARWAASGRYWRPLGYGLVLALLLVETFRLLGAEFLFGKAGAAPGWFAAHGPLIGRALNAAILVWAAVEIARGQSPAGSRTLLAAATAAALLGLLSIGAPGLASALLILLLGFAAGSRILLALGIAGLFGFVGHFYYSLDATLLEKSGLLALTGFCLLAGHGLLRLAFPVEGETLHA